METDSDKKPTSLVPIVDKHVDLEEGELSDDSELEVSKDFASSGGATNQHRWSLDCNPMEGLQATAGSIIDQSGGSGLDEFGYTELPRPMSLVRDTVLSSTAKPLLNDNELIYSTSSEDTSDSENEVFCRKSKPKRKRSVTNRTNSINEAFINPNSGSSKPEVPMITSTEGFANKYNFQNMANAFQTRKVNHVWADVLREQQLESAGVSFGKFSIGEPSANARLFDRGPESFEIDIPLRKEVRKRKRSEYTYISQDMLVKDVDQYYSSDVSISDDGLSEESFCFLEINKKEKDETAAKTGKSDTTAKTGENIRQRNRMSLANNLKKMSANTLTSFIAEKLNERRDDLVGKVVKLGNDVAVRLFLKTLKIERVGGLMIKKGTRRRSPGGVFFYLLRNDTKVEKKAIDAILYSNPRFAPPRTLP